MTTAAEMLTAIDAAILARVNGTSMEEAGSAQHKFKSMTLDELRMLRREYQGLSYSTATDARKMQRTKVTYTEVTEW